MDYFLYAKFPPPVNGQSLCAKYLIHSFREATGNILLPVNRIFYPEKNQFFKCLNEIISLFRLLHKLNSSSESVVIVSLCSGLGGWFDFLLVIFLLFRSNTQKIYIWYHSRAKSQGSTFSQKLIDFLSKLSVGVNIYHLVLDNYMLSQRLNSGISRKHIRILDNSYIFLGSKFHFKSFLPLSIPVRNPSLSFGYLSALSHDKGFDVFTQSMIYLSSKYQNIKFSCLIAGFDASNGLLINFLDSVRTIPNLEASYLGLIGEEKYVSFFPYIDFLLFPSCYRHEALPLTLIESICSSVIPIATDIGGIKDLIGNPHVNTTFKYNNFLTELDNLLNNNLDYSIVIKFLQNKLNRRISQSSISLQQL